MRAITTLQQLIEGRYTVTAHCGECQHKVVLDLDGLAERLGAGFAAVGDPNPLAARLCCEACGSKQIGLIISPPNVLTPGLALYGQKG